MQNTGQFCQAPWHWHGSRAEQRPMLKAWSKPFSPSSLQKPSSDFEGCSKHPWPQKKVSGKRRESSAGADVQEGGSLPGAQDSFKFHSFSGADHGKLCRFLSELLSLSGESMSWKEAWDLQTIAMPSAGGMQSKPFAAAQLSVVCTKPKACAPFNTTGFATQFSSVWCGFSDSTAFGIYNLFYYF